MINNRLRMNQQQWQCIQLILKQALKKNVFLQKKYADVGILSIRQITGVKDFQKLPFTTREELTLDQQAVQPFGTNLSQPTEKYLSTMSTSGTSTGYRLQLPLTNADYQRYVQLLHKVDTYEGVRPDDIFAYYTSQFYPAYLTKVQENNRGRYIGLTGDFRRIIESLIWHQITILKGVPTPILELTNAAIEAGFNLKKIPVRRLITTGEGVGISLMYRKFITKHWGITEFCDEIGMNEHTAYAISCSHGHHHFVEEFGFFEIIDPDTLKPATQGEVVLTSLYKHDYPLIRYRTGDVVKLATKPCGCGNQSPHILGGVIGRVDKRINVNGYIIFPESIEEILHRHLHHEYEIWVTNSDGVFNFEIFIWLPTLGGHKILMAVKRDLKELTSVAFQIHPLPLANFITHITTTKPKHVFQVDLTSKPSFKRRKLLSVLFQKILWLYNVQNWT